MNLKDVVTFIITDSSVSSTESLNAIITAVKERQRMNRANKTAIARATLMLGDVVTVSGISPKYLNGMKGKIVGFNKTRSRADINIIDNKSEYRISVGATQRGYPVQCLIPVETGVASSITNDEANALLDFMSEVG